jgi:predicted RNA binding protein YcfA (HicA-like mRNA interferase family)
VQYHVDVPPKIRELEARLRRAGFEKVTTKGSHRKWIHESGKLVVVSGRESDDAKRYQINDIEEAIAALGSPKT